MGRPKGEGKIVTSVTISSEFFNLAKQHNISFSEALRVGLSLMFADLDIMPYNNSLSLYRRMKLYQSELEASQAKVYELSQSIAQLSNNFNNTCES